MKTSKTTTLSSTLEVNALLQRTSRTFALAVPLLPDPLEHQVGPAYLLFRAADTLEDATLWSTDFRIEALSALVHGHSLKEVAAGIARECAINPPVAHPGYLELLGLFPDLVEAIAELPVEASNLIQSHWRRTVCRMIAFQERVGSDGSLRLADLNDLRCYCYAVAGIVGELLTELFLLHVPELDAASATLRALAPSFGEGLQLVNILKDAGSDAKDGRHYLPPNLPGAAMISIAREDLRAAQQYVDTLRKHAAPSGILGFTAMPVLLAAATLDEVEQRGPGARVARSTVGQIGNHLLQSLANGQSFWATSGGRR